MKTDTYMVTRPLANASGTITKLQSMGLETLHEPLLRVENLTKQMPSGSFDGLIITSTNAIPALDRQWQGLRKSVKVCTTGESTADAMREIGFSATTAIPGSARALANWLIDQHQTSGIAEKLLYPCAEQTAHDLPELLAGKGISCTSWPVYRTVEANTFSLVAHQALASEEIKGVLLYSGRTAQCFAQLLQNAQLQCPKLYTLSREIADTLPEPLRGKCRFPNAPNEAALLSLLPPV